MNQDKKINRLLLGVSIVVVGGFGFLGYGWYHTHEELNQTKMAYQVAISDEKEKTKNAQEEASHAEDQAQIAIQNNTNPASKQNEAMYATIKKVMKVFYNFTPENYTSREKEIKNELSESMRQQFFPQNVSNYQGTLSSKMTDLQIYSNIYYTKTGDKTSLVTVDYQTHYEGQETRKEQAVWKVSYNVEDKQITKIEPVGDELSE